MLLLFYDHKGATKALAILRAATYFLQRKHKCTLLCQVGFTVHDPVRMRLLVTLWPYAGVLNPKPRPLEDFSSSSSSSSSSDISAAEQQQAAVTAPSSSSSAADAYTDTSSSSSEAAVPVGSSSSSGLPQQRLPGWMIRCLEGSVPEPQDLPRCCSHLKPFALPDVISYQLTINASRHSEPPQLARLICSALDMKGRCRVRSAGGIAALHALTAVALAELMLMRSSSSSSGGGEGGGQGLAMHIRAAQRKEKLPAGSPAAFHVVRYYELTLLLCKRTGKNGELIPATCTFPVQRNSRREQQQQGKNTSSRRQQQRQQQWGLLQADEEEEGEGYLW
jgi:hypothetical protein